MVLFFLPSLQPPFPMSFALEPSFAVSLEEHKMRGFPGAWPCFAFGGVDPVDLAGPAPGGTNTCLGVTEHPAFIDFKPLQFRLHRSKVTQKWSTLEFLWVTWQHSGCSGSSPPCWTWAQPFQEEHSVALGSVELGQSVTLLLSGLSVCLECLCRQSAATQGSIDSNLLCLEY